MNKRVQRKVQKQAERAHTEELSQTARGRITLSFEHLRDAVHDFVSTLIEEANNVGLGVKQKVHTRVVEIEGKATPALNGVPVVGKSVARTLHELADATA